jgi:tetratricopeptide (TPR) repeat protein
MKLKLRLRHFYHRLIASLESGLSNKGLKIAREISDLSSLKKCYSNIGGIYCKLDDFEKAIESEEKALEIPSEVEDKPTESRCYVNLGRAHHGLNHFMEAIDFAKKALKIANDDKDVQVECYTTIGNSYNSLADFKKAIEYLEKALEIVKNKTHNRDHERIINLNLASYYYNSEPKVAYDYLKQSIELSELIGTELVEQEHKIAFYADASVAYKYMIPLCLREGKNDEGFECTINKMYEYR